MNITDIENRVRLELPKIRQVGKSKDFLESIAKDVRETANTVNTIASYFTKIRNLIKNLPDYTMKPRHIQFSEAILRMEIEEKKNRSEKQVDSLLSRSSNDRLVLSYSQAREVIEACIKLLNSGSYKKQLIGLVGLTGRRPIEILKLGGFEAENGETLFFTGQAKTKGLTGKDAGYVIPVLHDKNHLIQSFENLRNSHPEFKDVENTKLTNRATSGRDGANDIVKKMFSRFGFTCTYDLRHFYASFILFEYAYLKKHRWLEMGENPTPEILNKKIMGHSENVDATSSRKASMGASAHYVYVSILADKELFTDG